LICIQIGRNVSDNDGVGVRRRLLEGGADTGFHHVEPEKYTPRLFHFSGVGKKVIVTQVRWATAHIVDSHKRRISQLFSSANEIIYIQLYSPSSSTVQHKHKKKQTNIKFDEQIGHNTQ